MVHIVSVTPGVTFPSAVELPNKRGQPAGGTNRSSSNTSGIKQHKGGEKGAGLQIMAAAKKTAQQQTRDNQMLLLLDGGKRRWVRRSEWEKRA